jgi:hypothetical protein
MGSTAAIAGGTIATRAGATDVGADRRRMFDFEAGALAAGARAAYGRAGTATPRPIHADITRPCVSRKRRMVAK